MTRIGYAKLGRSMQFDPSRYGFQGNETSGWLLERLARRNPNVEFVLVGKNDGGGVFPSNVTNPWVGQRLSAYHQGKGEAVQVNEEAIAYEREVIIPMIAGLDGVIVHAGQHGTSHSPIPPADMTWKDAEAGTERKITGGVAAGTKGAGLTSPFVWAMNYGGYLVKGLNELGDATDGRAPVVYVCEDSRNYLKARDIKWPTGEDMILAQYAYARENKHERYHDTRSPNELGFEGRWARDRELWVVPNHYVYGGLEMTGLPEDWATWGEPQFEDRILAGIGTTSHKRGRPEDRRSFLVAKYLLPAFPNAEVQGKWDDESLADVPPNTVRLPDPATYGDDLARWRTTLVLPVAGTNWSTAKPWKCFASNTVAFHIGRVDDQGWMIPSRRRAEGTRHVGTVHGTPLYSIRDDWTDEELKLARWTRIERPEEFEKAATAVATSKDLWNEFAFTQRYLLHRRWLERRCETMIERRLGL